MNELKVMQIVNIISGNGFANPQRGRIYNIDGLSPTIDSCMGGNRETKILMDMATIEKKEKKQINLPPELQGKKFRIRKLTPRECFRLMGVDDADIDKIQASGISNSSQYKLAGNSIVVDVLFHIFRKMFIETEPDIEKGNQQQLTLF